MIRIPEYSGSDTDRMEVDDMPSLTFDDSLIEQTIDTWRTGAAGSDGQDSPAGPLFTRDMAITPTSSWPTAPTSTTRPTTTPGAYTDQMLYV